MSLCRLTMGPGGTLTFNNVDLGCRQLQLNVPLVISDSFEGIRGSQLSEMATEYNPYFYLLFSFQSLGIPENYTPKLSISQILNLQIIFLLSKITAILLIHPESLFSVDWPPSPMVSPGCLEKYSCFISLKHKFSPPKY